MLHREHGAMFARFGTVSDFTAGTLGEDAKIGQTCCPPVTATTDFLAPDILNKCDGAVPAQVAPSTEPRRVADPYPIRVT